MDGCSLPEGKRDRDSKKKECSSDACYRLRKVSQRPFDTGHLYHEKYVNKLVTLIKTRRLIPQNICWATCWRWGEVVGGMLEWIGGGEGITSLRRKAKGRRTEEEAGEDTLVKRTQGRIVL